MNMREDGVRQTCLTNMYVIPVLRCKRHISLCDDPCSMGVSSALQSALILNIIKNLSVYRVTDCLQHRTQCIHKQAMQFLFTALFTAGIIVIYTENRLKLCVNHLTYVIFAE